MSATGHYRILVAIETDATRYYGPEAIRPELLGPSDAEQLLAHLATDLQALFPSISSCSLIVPGAVFDQTQVLRPSYPVFEALEAGPTTWRTIDIQVLPGITAMLAAAAAAGAPLGHDFCAINLSDNLKPWDLIEKRVRLAIEADFAIALYNPRSKSRPEGFTRTLDLLREHCEPERLITFASAVSTSDQALNTIALKDATPEMADMRTVVLIGSSATRAITRDGHPPIIYTPRSVAP